MSGIVQNNILRTSGSIAVAAAGLNWSSTILTALTTFTVTVGNPGAGNRYYIDTVLQATVNLLEGFTYKFDQSDSSNSGHPLLFYLDAAKNTAYTTGVTTSGTPGNAGAYTQIVVASGAPTLYYQCSSHAGMGGQANTTAETVEAGNGYWIDTTSTTCTITLPSAAEKGDQIVLIDYARTWGTNAITIDSNGLNYQGDPDTLTVEYTTSGQSINIVYSDATKGWIPLEDDVTALEPVSPPTQRAIFGFGLSASAKVAVSNLVTSSGVIGNDVSAVGSIKTGGGGASYGGDKGILGFGEGASDWTAKTNLVNTSGVVSADATTVSGASGRYTTACSYGLDKAMFLYGYGWDGSANVDFPKKNLVSNIGIVSADATVAGTARRYPAATRYGGSDGGKAIVAYGAPGGSNTNISNLIDSNGGVGSDVSGVGTSRANLSASPYGGDKAIFAYGYVSSNVSMSNKVSNEGVVASDVSGVGTARRDSYGAPYGGDKGLFAYGQDSSKLNVKNLINNSGVIQADVTGVGTARSGPMAAGYSTSA